DVRAGGVLCAAGGEGGSAARWGGGRGWGVRVAPPGTPAVPDTVGGAGLVWDEADADLLAESIRAVITDETARAALARAGRQRYHEHFSNTVTARKFLGALAGLL